METQPDLVVRTLAGQLQVSPPGLSRWARMDRYGRALAVVCHQATPVVLRAEAGNPGFVIVSERSCHETNAAFEATLLDKGPRLASPQLFPYTLPGAAASEFAILSSIRGPTVVFPGGPDTALVAFLTATDFIRAGMAERVLVASADVLGPATVADWPAPESASQPWAEAAVALWVGAPTGTHRGPRRELTTVLGPALADVATLGDMARRSLAEAGLEAHDLAEVVCTAQAPHHTVEVAAATALAAAVPVLSLAFRWGDAGAPLGLLALLAVFEDEHPRLILTRGRSGSVAMVVR